MAQSTLDLIYRTSKQGTAGAQTAQELGQVQTAADKTGKSNEFLSSTFKAVEATAIAAGIAFLKSVPDLVAMGVQADRAEVALTAYAGSSEEAAAMTDAIKNATDGALSTMSAMANATRLNSMGLADNAQEMEKLTDIAVTLGATMGKGPQEAFEEFTLLLANQSILRLDTFGISGAAVRQRMEELGKEIEGVDRQTAFMMATMEIAGKKMEALDAAGFQATSNLDRLGATMDDAKLAAAGFFADGLMPIVDGAFAVKDATEAQEEATINAAGTYEDYIQSLGVVGDMTEFATDKFWRWVPGIQAVHGAATLATGALGVMSEAEYNAAVAASEQADETARLMSAVTSASEKYVPWAENMFYAEQALAAVTTGAVTQTGTLYALQQANDSVASSINFTSDATSLLNDVLVQEGDTLSETNARKIEYLFVTGEITKAEYEDLSAKNQMIQRLENLNAALAGNIISQEQWMEILEDGIVTVQELNDAMTATWSPTLDASIESSKQETEDMADAMQGVYDKTLNATEAMTNFAQAALDSGQPLSVLAGSLGGVVDPLTTGAQKAKELDDTLTDLDGKTVTTTVITNFVTNTSGGTGEGTGDTPIYGLRVGGGEPVRAPTGRGGATRGKGLPRGGKVSPQVRHIMALFGVSQEEAEMAVAAAAGGGASQAGMPLEPMKVPGGMMGLEAGGAGGRGGEVHYHLHVTVGSQAEGRDLARLFGELQALANI